MGITVYENRYLNLSAHIKIYLDWNKQGRSKPESFLPAVRVFSNIASYITLQMEMNNFFFKVRQTLTSNGVIFLQENQTFTDTISFFKIVF